MAFNNIPKNTHRRRRRQSLISEMNVTPLVDVMLVLLIIFMVTSPMLVTGVHVDLPETNARSVSSDDEPLVVTIDKSGEIYLLQTKVNRSDLISSLLNISKEKKDGRIFIRGDKNVDYGYIVGILSDINNAGFNKVALISDIKSSNDNDRK
jgi:biopolymer transport protein TolR